MSESPQVDRNLDPDDSRAFAYCRKIRDDENFWHCVEAYLLRHTGTLFSHGICPDCFAEQMQPQLPEQR